MAKNILQDIVPPEKRSIRNIPLPRRSEVAEFEKAKISVSSSSTKKAERIEREIEPEESTPRVYPYGSEKGPSFIKKYAIWFASFVAVLIVLFAISGLFTGATIKITPKTTTVKSSASTVLTAKQNSPDALDYQVITVTKDLGKSVPANGEEHVERKASGKIVILNTYDSNTQRLIKNTRFETPEGLIFRINESVVVPGRTGNGAQMTPGSAEVTVYADEPGEKYNIGLKDFTIPGFKGDPKYKAVYARSKTEMTGGFVGTINKVSDSDLASAQKEIHNDLDEALKKEALSQVPEDFVLFEGGEAITYDSLPQTDAKGSSVTINEKGTLNGVIFNKNKLAQYILAQNKSSFDVPNISISNLDSLNISIQKKENFSPLKDKEFTFTIDGDIKFVALFDTDKVKNDIMGQPKKNLNQILTKYSSIEKAEAVVKPFWKSNFPTNLKNITIQVITEK
jgi:hypothetical protein